MGSNKIDILNINNKNVSSKGKRRELGLYSDACLLDEFEINKYIKLDDEEHSKKKGKDK